MLYDVGTNFGAGGLGVLGPRKPVRGGMMRRRRIYEGKGKVLFEGPQPGTLVQYFKDDTSAFNNKKKGVITGKGVLNNRISEYLMVRLAEIGVPTHFVRRLNMREQLVREVEIIPIEVMARNAAAGSIAKRLGIEEGTNLPRPIVEYYLKNDELGDPMVTEEHITAFGWAGTQDLDDMVQLTLRVNDFLSGPVPRRRAQAGRLQARVRPPVGGRRDAHRPGRRDQPGFLPPVGHQAPTSAWTRTVSAATSAASRRRTRRSPAAWASCPRPARPISRAPNSSNRAARPTRHEPRPARRGRPRRIGIAKSVKSVGARLRPRPRSGSHGLGGRPTVRVGLRLPLRRAALHVLRGRRLGVEHFA